MGSQCLLGLGLEADVLGDGMIAKIELSQAIAVFLQRLEEEVEASKPSGSKSCLLL